MKADEIGRLQEQVTGLQAELQSLQNGFKTWDKSYKSDAKLKVFKIDKLQCEIDLLKEELLVKNEQITKLQVEL